MSWWTKVKLKLAFGAAVLVMIAALLVVRFAPVHLPALPPEAPPVTEGLHAVFGYATLANPIVRFVVIGRPAASRPARLEGFRRSGRDLQADPAASVAGRVFVVDAAGLERLDRYEQSGLRYDRRKKRLADGTHAWVYRMID